MKPIEERDLSRAEYAYKKLRDGIRAGEYHPGQRLREAELATQLAVSRTPIREAIRRLASDGLIEVAPSRGMMIIELGKQQVRELYALRKVLELLGGENCGIFWGTKLTNPGYEGICVTKYNAAQAEYDRLAASV